MSVIEVLFFIIPLSVVITPLLLAGIVHHLIIIHFNLFSSLSVPIDMHHTWRGKPIFGLAKTWRGFVSMIVLTAFFTWATNQVFDFNSSTPSPIIGGLLGLAYSLGELPNSFFKRQQGILPSQKTTGVFAVIDHFDSILACSVVVAIFYKPSLLLLFILILLGATLHFAVDLLLHKYSYKAKNP